MDCSSVEPGTRSYKRLSKKVRGQLPLNWFTRRVDDCLKLLADLQIGAVVDLSPSSAVWAEATLMAPGNDVITYLGVANNDEHRGLMCEHTDSMLIKEFTVKDGKWAKETDKADQVKEHFAALFKDKAARSSGGADSEPDVEMSEVSSEPE